MSIDKQIWAARFEPCAGAACDDAYEIVDMQTGNHVALIDLRHYGCRPTGSNVDTLKAKMEGTARAAHNAQLIAKTPQLLGLLREVVKAIDDGSSYEMRTRLYVRMRVLIAEAEGHPL